MTEAIKTQPVMFGAERIYHERGLAYMQSGNVDAAVDDFNTALDLTITMTDRFAFRNFVPRMQQDLAELEPGSITYKKLADLIDRISTDRIYK